MKPEWGDWAKPDDWDIDKMSPYVHWRISREEFKRNGSVFEARDLQIFNPELDKVWALVDRAMIGFDGLQKAVAGKMTAAAKEILKSPDGGLRNATVVMPRESRNHEFDPLSWAPGPDKLPTSLPPHDSVVVGVIDSGVPLSHRRTQDAEGNTRILAAWQQGATVAGYGQSEHVPFGRELYSGEIDRLLERHRPAGPDGPIDEEAFNREAGLVDMRRTDGHRELALRAAHGAHVLDIAAGFDPRGDRAKLLNKLPIIAVNLPSREIVGLSGSFLEFFIILGISRIVTLCDLLYLRALEEAEAVPTLAAAKGYRILINLSFGKSAGPRDGSSPLNAFVAALNRARKCLGLHEIDVIMPAGNDNLKRGYAEVRLAETEEKEIPWRILPEDRSSNYLEIWSDQLDAGGPMPAPEQLEISIAPPGLPRLTYVPGQAGRALELGAGVARVYCLEEPKKNDESLCRVHFLICICPTYANAVAARTAPAGLWRVAVRSLASDEKRVFFSIQTDQSAKPNAATGLRSYFDDLSYKVHEASGEVRDSFRYRCGERKRFRDYADLVQRHGSMNALADSGAVAVVGGYRLSDGAPAPYSGTGRGSKLLGKGRGAPTASFPTDDGVAHFGRLAAGSRDGSTARLRGTSFAASQATRFVALLLLQDPDLRDASAKWILFDSARSGDSAAQPDDIAEVDIEKIGGGRLRPKPTGYLDRMSYAWEGKRANQGKGKRGR